MASLHIAVLLGNEELTLSLLQEGFNPNAYDERLGTPLTIAILKGHGSIAKILHQNGGDLNDERLTSALVHSRLDEFKLPNPFSTVDKNDVGRNQASRTKHDGGTIRQTRQPAADENETDQEDDSQEDATSDTNPDISIGSKSEVKILFKNGSEWKETPAGTAPGDDFELVDDPQEAYVVVKYMDSNKGGGWMFSKMNIHGNKVHSFLSRVLEGYPGVRLGKLKTTLDIAMEGRLDPEFGGLFHRANRFIKLSEDETDPLTKEHSKLLLQCLKPLWRRLQNYVDESRATGFITWAQLWTIFVPGEIAILKSEDKNDNAHSAAKIIEVQIRQGWNEPPRFVLTVEVVDWNGSYSGYKRGICEIPQYGGFKKILDVGIYPLSYDPDHEKLKQSLIQRGRNFERLRGYFFMTREEFNATRRLIIDNYAYYRFQEHCIPTFENLGDKSPVDENITGLEHHGEVATQALLLSPSRTGGGKSLQSERNEDLRPLTDNECLLCVPTMKGFDVQEKKWRDIPIHGLENVTWNDEAFNQLAIEENRKRLILAFAKQKQIESNKFDDFIPGKGKSFIILLCGPPGVGKTLTAESVAERTRAPLYTLSAGDLGTDAGSVESSLKEALELCAIWKAVMLIDEADVFLESRTTDNLQRNELVSVFLRLLEYYKGILFLTTNRVATIDTAFESRIDLIIPYEEFNQAARREVWANFADNLRGNHELSGVDFDELSQRALNGREIKSTVKTSLMLAESEGERLQMKHLKVVLEVRERAADYLHSGA